MQIQHLVGVDEAGRGPLAGPVAVGLVAIPNGFDWKQLPGVRDSKQLSTKQREGIFDRAKELKEAGKLDFVVVMMSAKDIDRRGISAVIRLAIEKGLEKLQMRPEACFIKLDGSLKAPAGFSQETIIKGDQKEQSIGLASVCAKETRDAYMRNISKKLPGYGFDVHKGYGTKKHRLAIFQNGLSIEHRESYCQNWYLWGKV